MGKKKEFIPKGIAKTKFKVGDEWYLAEAIEYKDGIGCTLSLLLEGAKEGIGLCFDFPIEALPKIIESLKKLEQKITQKPKGG